MNIMVIDSAYSCALATDVRDINSSSQVLRQRLTDLGRLFGEKIVGDEYVSATKITTPMGRLYNGLVMAPARTVVVSTRDDYEYFANGISVTLPGEALRGYMDFGGLRGPDTLSSGIRAIELPTIKIGQIVDTVIIAKSVLASGCTAISLAKKAMSIYYPPKLIIAAVFYSEQGIYDLYSELPNIHAIYIHNEPDNLTQDGMLIPGVGNIDQRLDTSDEFVNGE